MRLRSFAGFRFSVIAAAFIATAFVGCKKQEATSNNPPANPAPKAGPVSAGDPDQPPPLSELPPPYTIPDKLPASATLSLVKTDDGAAIYRATFTQSFTYDSEKAQLALDVNTVGWAYHGRLVITNKDDADAAGARTHDELYDEPPTTDKLDFPEEHVLLNAMENQWIKEGGITITIRNAEASGGATAAPPKVLSVDLVAQ